MRNLIISAAKISKYALQEASQTDSVDNFPERTLAKIINAGLLKVCMPSKYGGENVGLVPGTNEALLTILKHIGSGNLVMGRVLEGHINAQLLINEFGTKSQIKKYAEDVLDGKLFAVWNTQGKDGTFLTKKKNKVLNLNGSKTFATAADYVSRPIVTAVLENGAWQMCVIKLNKTEVKIDKKWWNPMGMLASGSFKISFKNTAVKTGDLLGKPNSYYLQPSFSGGCVRFASVQLGAAERLLTETKIYLSDLGRTDDAYQKMRIGKMEIAMTSGNQWLKSAADHMDFYIKYPTEENSARFLAFSNMMRTAIEDICTNVMALCQKCVGARGLNKPYHFERIIRDLNTYLRQPAPDGALADVGKFVMEQKEISDNLWDLDLSKNKKL